MINLKINNSPFENGWDSCKYKSITSIKMPDNCCFARILALKITNWCFWIRQKTIKHHSSSLFNALRFSINNSRCKQSERNMHNEDVIKVHFMRMKKKAVQILHRREQNTTLNDWICLWMRGTMWCTHSIRRISYIHFPGNCNDHESIAILISRAWDYEYGKSKNELQWEKIWPTLVPRHIT